jgi:tetratricopeptide (TPR) repeat protein
MQYLYASDVLVLLGDNYYYLGDLNRAHDCYLEASYIVPHKFIPRYKLTLVLLETGQLEKAKILAKEIVNEQPKIQSSIVDHIKADLYKRILNH